MSRPLILAGFLVVCGSLALYWGWEGENEQETGATDAGSTGISLFAGIEELDPAVSDKIKRDEPLSDEDWRRIHEHQILYLERFDEKAARLAREQLETGRLSDVDAAYLSWKRDEMQRYRLDEWRKQPMREGGALAEE